MAMVRLLVLLGAVLVAIAVAVVVVVVIVMSNNRSRRLPPAAQPGWPQATGQTGAWPGRSAPGGGLLSPADQQPPSGRQVLGQQGLAGQADPDHMPPRPPQAERPDA